MSQRRISGHIYITVHFSAFQTGRTLEMRGHRVGVNNFRWRQRTIGGYREVSKCGAEQDVAHLAWWLNSSGKHWKPPASCFRINKQHDGSRVMLTTRIEKEKGQILFYKPVSSEYVSQRNPLKINEDWIRHHNLTTKQCVTNSSFSVFGHCCPWCDS